MMKDPEKVNMEINIGGEKVQLAVPFQKQELTRDVEDEANRLFARWQKAFPDKNSRQLLSMMVYQYAFYYKELTLRYQEAQSIASDCLESLDDIKF